MTSFLGQTLILLSIVTNFSILFFYRINFKNNNRFKNLISYLVRINFFIILLSFICLIFAYIISDFNNINVFYNSHTSKPLIYKISGAWGNHEGSMLLWILIMSAYTFFFSYEKNINLRIKNLTIIFQIIMTLGFLIFLAFTSNPFLVNSNNFDEGLGLNPILQDPALAIHPPLLYIGYVGYSLILSLALATLYNNDISKNWSEVTKKYAIFCWSFLTLGIAAGSFWAYYELGWGGWWFWDPVENASLMPWLAGLALIHSLKVLDNNSLKKWIIFLSILCFSLSLLGTFLVRSGVLMSVHAFANDLSRGIFILIIFLVVTGFSFLVFLLKVPNNNKTIKLLFLNKTSAIILNNITMCVVCFTVLLGTIYPLIIESITNERISVGPPYYNSTVIPILIPGLLLMAVAPILNWKENNYNKIKKYSTLLIFLVLSIIIIKILININIWGIIGIAIAIWIIVISFNKLIQNFKIIKGNSLIKYIQLNSSLISHFGVGILIIGITSSSIWKKEFSDNLLVGENLEISGYTLFFEKITELKEKNYMSLKAQFILEKKGVKKATIIPEKRYFPVSKTITTEAGIKHFFWQDIYIVLGENINETWSIKVYQNPLISFIWLGVFIIFFGSITSIKNK